MFSTTRWIFICKFFNASYFEKKILGEKQPLMEKCFQKITFLLLSQREAVQICISVLLINTILRHCFWKSSKNETRTFHVRLWLKIFTLCQLSKNNCLTCQNFKILFCNVAHFGYTSLKLFRPFWRFDDFGCFRQVWSKWPFLSVGPFWPFWSVWPIWPF